MTRRRVEPTVPAAAGLRKGDVLLQFDETIIGVDGTVPFRSGERINFSYLISQKHNNEQVSMPPPPFSLPSTGMRQRSNRQQWLFSFPLSNSQHAL